MFPKKGNNFQRGNQRREDALTYPVAISVALRAELGGTHQAVKTLMRWTKANERTVKNWLSGTTGPRGEHLLDLMRHSDAALTTVLQMAGRNQFVASHGLLRARGVLIETLTQIDSCMGSKVDAPPGRIP